MTRRRNPAALGSMAMLVLAALLMRSLVPVGWMPADEGLGIQPCLDAAVIVALERQPAAHHAHHGVEPAKPDKHDEHPQGQKPCSFAALGLALAAPADASAALELLPPDATALDRAASREAPHRSGEALPPPQTGPPSFA